MSGRGKGTVDVNVCVGGYSVEIGEGAWMSRKGRRKRGCLGGRVKGRRRCRGGGGEA